MAARNSASSFSRAPQPQSTSARITRASAASGRADGGGGGRCTPHPRGGGPRLAPVLGADAAGRDIGGSGFLLQEIEVEQFEEGRVAAGQPVGERADPLAREQPHEFTTQLKHAATPVWPPSRYETTPARSDG